MAIETKIAWTDHTYNPWWGCTKISPGCDHCYAEAFDKRVGGDHWGAKAPRRRMKSAALAAPLKWNQNAEKAATRAKVFCASMADVFDNAVPTEWRDELWAMIRMTPWLQWQLLTKRPQNIAAMLPPDWGCGFHNVWLGTTVENQTEADRRIPVLLDVPAVVRFLSCEPLLEHITLTVDRRIPDGIDWVIVGGESGHGARVMPYVAAMSLLQQCKESETPVFFKQFGTNRDPCLKNRPIQGKGDTPAEWPTHFQVQQFPTPRIDR